MNDKNKVTVFFDFISELLTDENGMKGFNKAKMWFQSLRMLYDIGIEMIANGGQIINDLGEALNEAQVVSQIDAVDPDLAEAARTIFDAVKPSDTRSVPTPTDPFVQVISDLF